MCGGGRAAAVEVSAWAVAKHVCWAVPRSSRVEPRFAGVHCERRTLAKVMAPAEILEREGGLRVSTCPC